MSAFHPELSELERAAKCLDEVLVLFGHYREIEYNIVREALRIIARCRKSNPNYPITVGVAEYMRTVKLL